MHRVLVQLQALDAVQALRMQFDAYLPQSSHCSVPRRCWGGSLQPGQGTGFQCTSLPAMYLQSWVQTHNAVMIKQGLLMMTSKIGTSSAPPLQHSACT